LMDIDAISAGTCWFQDGVDWAMRRIRETRHLMCVDRGLGWLAF
jgi:hypothetical protein